MTVSFPGLLLFAALVCAVIAILVSVASVSIGPWDAWAAGALTAYFLSLILAPVATAPPA